MDWYLLIPDKIIDLSIIDHYFIDINNSMRFSSLIYYYYKYVFSFWIFM